MTIIVLAAFIKDGRVLMGRRADHKKQFPGHWDLIGGHVDEGETLEFALIREAQEEVGLMPITFRDLGTFHDDETETKYHMFVVTEWSNGPAKLLGDEHTELKWVRVTEATSLCPLAHPSLISVVGQV